MITQGPIAISVKVLAQIQKAKRKRNLRSLRRNTKRKRLTNVRGKSKSMLRTKK
jgi:hypothetical protein